jgi:type I restriction enzyme S subunit
MINKTQYIPEGWKVKTLDEVGSFSKGSGITKNDLVENGLPCIRYAELYTKYNFMITNCFSFIPDEVSKEAKPILYGDILLAGSGEIKEEIGKCATYVGKEQAYAGEDNVIFSPKKELDSVFASYYLNTIGRKQLNTLGQGDSIVHIHAKDLKNVYILIPPLPEQSAIAEVLGCWDEGIEKLEKIITLKEQQKKGLMQRLLTGKTRLRGFSEPWKEVKLGEVLQEVRKRNKELQTKQVLSITNNHGFILPEEQFSRVVASEDITNYKIVTKGEFAYNPSRLNVGSIDRLDAFQIGALSPMYVIFKCTQHIFSDYLKHWIKTSEFILKVKSSAQGSVRETVDFNTLSSIKTHIPSDISEQSAIASILSTADDEISQLKQKLFLFKQQKKWLMQQLLTGKKRLKIKKEN